ncbi:MAG TPA: hypothetical protein VFI27_13865 [candidate division Zixibacteria bacterium]|nr:hypothetical protein [candidate division Zixibacteria bacterium]
MTGLTPEIVTASFVVCPRCSFFLSGYKLIQTDFTDAVAKSDDGWLDLTWSHETRRLVLKTYGYRIDEATIHHEGLCRECQRVFVFGTTEEEIKSSFFRIEVVPG